MNDEIMEVSNHLVYGYRMKCAGTQVAKQRLLLPRLSELPLPHYMNSSNACHSNSRMDWLYCTLIPAASVVFLNTDNLSDDHLHPMPSSSSTCKTSTRKSVSVSSVSEAKVVATILWGLRLLGYKSAGSVGVITPYRAQVKLIQQIIEWDNCNNGLNNEISLLSILT